MISIVRTLTDGLVPVHVCRFDYDGDDRPLWALCEPGDPPRPLCRHEHTNEGSVLCAEARDARRGLDAVERRRRIAALPAPEGARYVEHCGSYWPAAAGGACPACGQAGTVLVPTVRVDRSHSLKGWWLRVECADVVSAVSDLGAAAEHTRVMDSGMALVMPHGEITDTRTVKAALERAGWRVVDAHARRSA